MSYEIANRLDEAADYLEKVGWMQGGSNCDSDPWYPDSLSQSVCLEGAIGAVMTEDELRVGMSPAVNNCPMGQAVREYLGWEATSLPLYTWNDRDGRTQEEVLGALRGAAKYQRMKEDGLV